MSEGYLHLSAHFGERQRAGSVFVAEDLLDLFTDWGVASSVMLRGIAGFGARHILRSDRSLSLSEDPPVVVTAVDVASTIQAVLGDVTGVVRRGLVTVQPAVLLSADSAGAELGDDDDELKLTVHVGRGHRINGLPAYRVVCALLHEAGFAGAVAFLGVDGVTGGQRRRAHFFSFNDDVPARVVAVGTAAQTRAAVPGLVGALGRPLLTVQHTRVCKRDGDVLSRPTGAHRKMVITTDEATLYDGAPIHRELVRRLRAERAAAGVTVVRGIWGYHGAREPHGDRLVQLGRRVPVTTTVVDTPERIAGGFDLVDQVTADHAVVTCEAVPTVLVIDNG